MKFYISRYEPLKEELAPLSKAVDLKEDSLGHYVEIDFEGDTLEKLDFLVTKLSNESLEYRFMVQKSEHPNGTIWELILLD